MGKEIIDLKQYEDGKKKMMITCSHKGCNEKKDITKEYISVEKQNNIRRKSLGDKFDPACDELIIYGLGYKCEEHRWDQCWVCKYCNDAKFMSDWDLSIHQLVCSKKKLIPQEMNWWEWFRKINWGKMDEYKDEIHYIKSGDQE